MMILSFLLLLFGLNAVSRVNAKRVALNIGNDKRLDILRQLDAAQKSGNEKLSADLKTQLKEPSFRSSEDHHQWRTDCSVSASVEADIIVANDPSDPPEELKEVMPFLDEYWRTDDGEDMPYPGDFDGFMHPDGFRILRMNYDALPAAVRKWREDELEKGTSIERKFIAVQDSVAFFAPGVVTYLMPLFATKDVVEGANACEDELADLSNYYDPARASDSARFKLSYGGKMQIGDSITVQISVKKLVKETEGGKEEIAKESKEQSKEHRFRSEL